VAVLKAPLLSLGASGQFGKAIVFGTWKGLKVARQHVDPANPNTADQQTQRTLVTDQVAAWKNYFTGAEGRAAWNRSALNDSRPMSGFNKFMSEAMLIAATDADASFVNVMTEIAAQKINYTLLNLDDGAQADEAGDFECWGGATITGMILVEEIALAGGDIVGVADYGDEGDVVYCKVRKGGQDRSGIFKATLLAA